LYEPVDLMPGNKMGPTVQPVRELVGSGDPWDGETNLDDIDKGNRLVYVIVYDPKEPLIISGGGGAGSSGTQAEILPNVPGAAPHLWFAGFYLDDITGNGNNGWVTGKYAGIMLEGTGGEGSSSVAKHLRLVE
jgi:hypothetical protein